VPGDSNKRRRLNQNEESETSPASWKSFSILAFPTRLRCAFTHHLGLAGQFCSKNNFSYPKDTTYSIPYQVWSSSIRCRLSVSSDSDFLVASNPVPASTKRHSPTHRLSLVQPPHAALTSSRWATIAACASAILQPPEFPTGGLSTTPSVLLFLSVELDDNELCLIEAHG
jgi:hypothetical protein